MPGNGELRRTQAGDPARVQPVELTAPGRGAAEDAPGRERPTDGSTTIVRPGALTQLLADLARAPEGAGWDVPLEPGQSVGRFEIQREIGRGGFGVVYEARDTELGRSVAFKAIRASGADAAREARALGEAEAAARLAHPNIVHLYDVGRSEQGAFLIMELLRGKTLAGRLREGPLPLREAVRVAVEISRGLAHAHQQGVLHRDLKPSNVFLCDDGQVKVLDFGLAHVFGRAGVAGGTPAYMAPEQAKGETGDERSDVYSLGVVIREMLAEASPLSPAPAGERGLTPMGTAVVRGRGDLAPRGLPAALHKLLARMLAPDPAERPSSGGEAHEQLAAIQESLRPKRLLWAALSVAAAALVGAGTFAYFWQRPLPQGRLLTALADTENATGDPSLDAVSGMLLTGLEQSKRVSVMARSRLLNLLRDAGATEPPRRIGEREARAAARQAGAKLLVVPAIREMGSEYDLEARLVELERGQTVVAPRERARSKATIPEALDRLTSRVRAALRESPEDALGPPVRIAEAAPSQETWRHYADWLRLRSEGRQEADSALKRLLAADPEFPLARVQQAIWTGDEDLEEGIRHMEAALSRAGRMSPKERAIVEAMAVPFRGGSQYERLRLLDRVIANWPEEPSPHVWAGNILLLGFADLPAARPYLERALAIARFSPVDEITFLCALGRLDAALARARRWADEAPSARSLGELSRVHRMRGEAAEALEAARRSLSLEPSPGVLHRWAWIEADELEELEALLRGTPQERDPHWLGIRGRWHQALAALDGRAPPATASDGARGWYHWLRADLVAHGLGDPDATWREAVAHFEGGAPRGPCTAVPLAVAGALAAGRRVVNAFVTHEGVGCVRTFEAFERWQRGDREGALRSFEGIFTHGSEFHRGQVLAEMGRDREAVAAFRGYRRVVDFPPWVQVRSSPSMTAAYYGRSLLLEATSLERLGERDEALAVAKRLQRLWKNADGDFAPARQAAALRSRLAAETGRK